MERFVVLGFQQYEGDFEGRHYSGMKLYVQNLQKTADCGIVTELLKFKAQLLPAMPIQWTDKLIGQTIEVVYDRYGNPSSARVVEE